MTAADPAALRGGGVGGWVRRHVPTREAIGRNRWLRPVAHFILRPSLWRLNRRSVPRAAAVGMFCSVLFPFAHMPAAALISVPARANVPVAVAITIPGLFIFSSVLMPAKYIGSLILRLDRGVPGHPLANNVHAHHGVLAWFAANGPAAIVGLLVLAPILAAASYFVASRIWRLRIARQWRGRARKRRAHNAN